MDKESFKQALADQGFDDVMEKSMVASHQLDDHDHPFDVLAMVTDGEITLTVDGKVSTYSTGDTFTMDSGCTHKEAVGSQGVSFIVGKRHT